MSEFDRRINEEEDRLRREGAEGAAWESSAFSPYNPQVRLPSGRFAALVSEVLPRIPKHLWKVAYVGRDPDGLVRVTGPPYLGGTEESPSESPLRLWWWKRGKDVTKCRVFAAEAGLDGFVLLDDGRAGYTGDVAHWRDALPSIIARKDTKNGLSFSGGKYGMFWQFE